MGCSVVFWLGSGAKLEFLSARSKTNRILSTITVANIMFCVTVVRKLRESVDKAVEK